MNKEISIPHILTILVVLLNLSLANSCVQRPQPNPTPLAIQVAELKLNSGVISFEQGNYYGAKIQFSDALTVYRSIDHTYGKAQAHLNLAKTYMAAGNLHKANDQLHRSRQLASQENITELNPYLDIMASSLAIKEKQWDKSLNILSRYLPKTAKATHNNFTLAALENRILIAFKTEPANAGPWVTMLDDILNKNGKSQPAHVAKLLRFKGRMAQQQGNQQSRDNHFRAALNIYRKNTARPSIAATLYEWGSTALTSNQMAQAEDLLKRSLAVRISMQDYTGCIETIELLLALDATLKKEDIADQLKAWLSILQKKEQSQLPALLPERFSLQKIIDTF